MTENAMEQQMSKDRFLQLLGTYGPDISKWPADVQQRAHVYSNRNPAHFASEMEVEIALEKLLATRPTAIPNSALRLKILQSFDKNAQQQEFNFLGLMNTLFGFNRHSSKLAFASMALLMICGGFAGYTGYEIIMGVDPSSEFVFDAVTDPSFSLDEELGT